MLPEFSLSALSIVDMKALSITGRVGEDVTFTCPKWKATTFDVKSYVKYLCESPCSGDKQIIAKAAPGKTIQQNRISLKNAGKELIVTFTNLHKSDSKIYFCGLEKYFSDDLKKVDLKVINGKIMFFIFI